MMIRDYRAQLCNEFIKNEEDWLARSSNIEALKKSRKERKRNEELHKKNVGFIVSLTVAFVMVATVIAMVICAFSIILPKNIDYYESRYSIEYHTHIVESGETLTDISKSIVKAHPELNNNVGRWNYDDLIIEVNHLDNPNMIYPGDEIIYPVF